MEALLAGQFVVGFCLLRHHLGHVSGTLTAHLLQHLRLPQQQRRLLHLLVGHPYQTFIIRHIGESLQHIEGRQVTLATEGRLSHQFAGLSRLQGMQTAEAVEQRQRRRHLVAVIEGAHVGITVGLGIYGTAVVVLGADACIHVWQESADSARSLGFVVVEFQLGPFHHVVVLHSILHALPSRPILRPCGAIHQVANDK